MIYSQGINAIYIHEQIILRKEAKSKYKTQKQKMTQATLEEKTRSDTTSPNRTAHTYPCPCCKTPFTEGTGFQYESGPEYCSKVCFDFVTED